jgi:hypothetical protein
LSGRVRQVLIAASLLTARGSGVGNVETVGPIDGEDNRRVTHARLRPASVPVVASDALPATKPIGVWMTRSGRSMSHLARGWMRALTLASLVAVGLAAQVGVAAARPQRQAVSAGRDRRVVVGDTIKLEGRVARTRTGSLDRWKVTYEPRNARGRKAASLRSSGLVARFRARVPGVYRLRLAVGRGAAAISDSMSLTEIPATPMVPVDTMVGDLMHQGIMVGGKTYHQDGDGLPFAQVLVLERNSLALVSNTSYWGDDSPGEMEADLKKLPATDLVIVNIRQLRHHELCDDGNLIRALSYIGAKFSVPCDALPVDFSAIGVPGMHAGEANQRVAPTKDSAPPAAMRGYLSPDQYLEYGYVPSTQVTLDYGADDRCAHAPGCVAGRGGYLVRVFDPHTFKPANGDGSFFWTTGDGNAEPMAKALDSIPQGDLVTVESVGAQARNGPNPPSGPFLRLVGPLNSRQTMMGLDAAIARIGGTRNGFNHAAEMVPADSSHGDVYTLVGWAGAREGQGAESAAGLNGVGATARLSLVLRPDRDSLLRPAEVSTNADHPGALSTLVLDRGKDTWPLADDAGAMRAFSYLGSTDEQLGSDPRSAYWSQNLNQSATNAIIAKLDHVSPPPGADFTQEQFDTARAELIKELGWVGKVRAYLNDLSSPFTDNALSSWAGVQTIADKVHDSIDPPNDEIVTSWLELVTKILQLAAPFSEGGTADVADLLDFGVWAFGADKLGAATNGEFRVKANELGARLVERAQDAKQTYDRVGDAIVSDYADLRELGTHAGCNPGPSNPGCPPQWAFTKADQARASVNVYRAAQAIAYETLVPLVYHVYELLPADLTKPPTYQEQYKCGAVHPFSYVPTNSSATLLQTLDPAGGNNEYQVYVLGVLRALHLWADPPRPEIASRMFDPVPDTADPNAGGLGISPERFLSGAQHIEAGSVPAGNCFWQP